ncbi:hypothetical protein ONZ45_g17267 [Pleurotus djamor]|nr:hypothetical protein ONZ45_g17267 [Pleurotus djamor]
MEYHYPANSSSQQAQYSGYAGHTTAPAPPHNNFAPHPMNYALHHGQQPHYQQPSVFPPPVQMPVSYQVQNSSPPVDHFGILPEIPELSAQDEFDTSWEAFVFPSSGTEQCGNDHGHGSSYPSHATESHHGTPGTMGPASLPQASQTGPSTCTYCEGTYFGIHTLHVKNECTSQLICKRRTAFFAEPYNLRMHQRSPPDHTGLTACDKNLRVVEDCLARGIDVPKLRGRLQPVIDPNQPPKQRTPFPAPRPSRSKRASGSVSKIYTCYHCGLPPPKGETLLDHVSRTCQKRPAHLTCKRCDTTFPELASLTRHLSEIPDSSGRTCCDRNLEWVAREAARKA